MSGWDEKIAHWKDLLQFHIDGPFIEIYHAVKKGLQRRLMLLSDKDVGNHLSFTFYDACDIEPMIIIFGKYNLMTTLNDYHHVFLGHEFLW